MNQEMALSTPRVKATLARINPLPPVAGSQHFSSPLIHVDLCPVGIAPLNSKSFGITQFLVLPGAGGQS